MESILQGLHDLEGVHGAFVADSSGQIVAYKAHTVYDLAMLQQVGRMVGSAIDSLKLMHEDWESVTASFSEGKMLIRNLASKGKGPSLTLSLIADSRLNPSFAGVAVRVAVGKLRAIVEGTATASTPLAGSGPMAPSLPVSSPVMSVPAAASAPSSLMGSVPKVAEVATSGLSWSGIGPSSSMSGSGVAVADAASSALLTLCTKTLAKSVGPMAKVFVKESARRVCPERPFSKDQAKELIADLVKHIEDPAEANQFRQAILKSL